MIVTLVWLYKQMYDSQGQDRIKRMGKDTLIVCHECDVLQRVKDLPPGGTARCVCCGAKLFGKPRGGLDSPLALMLAALILYLVANLFPFLTLDVSGRTNTTTLSGASLSLYQADMPELAAVVWFTSVIAPGMVIGGTLYILLSLRFTLRLPWVMHLLRWLSRLSPWGMMDVFMLGVLVALVKLVGLADVVVGPGMYAFTGLIFVFAAAAARIELHLLWDMLERQR
jgi:paraquat-inducible protein A